LAYPYQRSAELVNETDFPARYELLSQEETAKNVYSYASKNGSGIILPHSSVEIPIDVQLKRLGQINFPIFFKIYGNEDIPLGVDISASGIGPNVLLSTTELNWGKIQVLKENVSTLTLTNDSPIPANFTCATVSDSSVFRVEPQFGTIAPGGTINIDVTAYLDDTLKFTDILKVGVQSDGIHEVQLVARGQGTTITFDEGLRLVDFQDVFSNRECSREFILVNKGRRAQTLHWSTDEDRFARKDINAAINQVFEVIPSRFSLKPNGQQVIVVKGYANKAVKCKETLICQCTIDKDPARKVVVEMTVVANFINPLLDMIPPLLKFVSAHTRDEDFELLSQNLTLRNTSPLPLHLSFKCPIPYSVEPNEVDHRLNHGESVTVTVNYDPKYNTNRVSCKEHAKLWITYSEHPQRDLVELFSEITFPNLIFTTNSISFGCIPNDTEQKKTFQMTNCSSLPVEYAWSFLEGSIRVGNITEPLSIHQVFDIQPTRSFLFPGETETVEVTFLGHSGGTFAVTALCDVVGGPKYEVTLRGESSVIEYSFDKQILDFGTQSYQDILEQELVLSNTGQVTFDFNTIIFPSSSLSQRIMVSPSSGTILPHGKQKISVRFCPYVPEPIDDCFFIQLALFEPVKIRVMGTGIFPHIQMNIPRLHDPEYDLVHNEAKQTFMRIKRKTFNETDTSRPSTDSVHDIEIDAEAERLLLKTRTLSFLSKLSEEVKAKIQIPPKTKVQGSPILIFKSQQKTTKEKRVASNISESSQVQLANYVCNFGNVIRNTSRKKNFRLTNRSLNPISFQLDKSVLVGTGFSIEPDRVKLLPGHPYYESTEFQVTFQARSQNVGTVEVELPINIFGGPTTKLTLRADVTLPDLQLSSSEVDFGEVLCGHRKTVNIQLHNKNNVPCEWTSHSQDQSVPQHSSTTQKTSTVQKKKSAGFFMKEFDLVPSSGVLQPGEKVILSIKFSPTDEKEYDVVVPIKVNMNSQLTPLHLFGRGFKPQIQFEPEALTLGPILPCSEGTEARFSIYNPTNYPIEVYSLEFDQVYLEEEEILRNVDNYDGNTLYLPPREPGQGLPEYIIEAANQKLKQKSLLISGTTDSATGKGALSSIDASGVGELIDSVSTRNTKSGGANPSDNSSDHMLNLILHGAPYSGRTTQAKRLAKTFGISYVRLDEVIESYMATEGVWSESSMKGREVSVKSSFEPIEDRLLIRRSSALPEESKLIKEEHSDQFEEHRYISDDTIVEIVRLRMQKDECRNGAVFDGLESRFVMSPVSLLKAIIRALGDKKKIAFIHLTLDTTHIRERELNLQRQNGDLELDPLHIKDVTEEEYDHMTEAEREHYDTMLLKLKKRVKELQDRRKQERKHWEEELALRVGERKNEDDNGKGSKKKPARRTTSRQGPPQEKGDKPVMSSLKAESKVPSTKGSQEKGSLSPKASRKWPGDKMAEKEKVDKNEKSGQNDLDEYSSRFTLNDVGDAFINDATFKRLESYSIALDAILTVVRDGEKPSAGRQIPNSANPDKKTIRGGKGVAGTASYTVDGPANASIQVDSEAHTAEDPNGILYREVNGVPDEETVFRSIVEFLPSNPKMDEAQTAIDIIPPPYLQQIVYLPAEREPQAPPRFFQLVPPPPSSEVDDETTPVPELQAKDANSKVEPTTSISTVTAINQSSSLTNQGSANAGVSSTNSTSMAGANKKGGRPAQVKVAEDTKAVEVEEEVEKDSLARYRWIILPKERKELVVKFSSNEIGKFEQTLQFEIMGSRAKYPLICTGHCRYSQIVSDYRKIFPKWKKAKEDRYISHGEYIASSGVFEFGPLLYSKPREKYLEKFPENRATLIMSNSSPHEIKLAFALKNDVKSDIFFFDPPSMDLAPGQSQTFTVWAYPRSANYFEDTLIICVKDNPEPYCYKISCIGSKPELEIDKRQLSFDKLLLGRCEKREIKLRNNTFMPVAWKLAQVELLGDEFTVLPLEGVIEPFQEQAVTAEFRGMKPVVISRRSIRLEVSDTEKIGGVVQEVPIIVTAEAYDIAMDLHFPKGYDGGLDFGVLKVLEEGKQMCTLKNKGKYEVGFKFTFESKDLSDIFTIIPQQGIMQPSDKPFAVQVILKANREMVIRDANSLKCQFYEPTTGEVTATIPVKLLARAVFSRFSILPVRDLNFGALVHGTKATRQFTVENQGEFDFRYSIYKIIQGANEVKTGTKLRTNSRASKTGRSNSPPTQKVMNRKELVKQADAANFGSFTVFPTSGVVPAGSKHQVTVEFHSDNPGSFEEIVAIDISDRSPNDYLDVIEYRLVGESCVPGINTADFASIFEEQTVCKRLELFNTQANVYAEEDRVFYFGAFLAGQQAQVRFKISNPFKVPCDVLLSTKPRSRTKSDAADFAFDVEPKKLSIPSHEYRYVVVSFHPTSIQSYAGIFEALVENVDQSRSRTLLFELRGEGTLPRVTIEKPTLKNKVGLPLMKFRRLLVGASQTLPIVLRNEGNIPAKIKLDWGFKEMDEFACPGVNMYHTLRPQESRAIDVTFRAVSIKKVESELRVRVIDNSFEDSIIQLFGESYVDEITFDYLPNDAENELLLNDCFVGETKQVAFTVSNHSNDLIRLVWASDNSEFIFSPTIAHLKPQSRREFTVSFCAKQPVELNHIKAICRLSKIRYINQSMDTDWDDKSKTVRWLINDSKVSSPRKIIEAYPEPQYETLPPPISDHYLLITAFADYCTYECDATHIKFKGTLMYQTRVYRFNLRNSGKVQLKYAFSLYEEDGHAVNQEECPFSISPSSGAIDPGDNLVVTLRFSPKEDAVYNYILACTMQNLAKECKPLSVKVYGTSLRPFCHFELEESDYITSERRSPDTGSSNGVPSVLPQNTKVIEFGSCGVKVKNTKRFYIVNPTDIPYEFEWSSESSIDQRVFRCLTPKGLVLSNKKYEIIFEFIPESVDLKVSILV
jgi:adenylate kinase family enzyme